MGRLFRVHRGQVTGANGIWIASEHTNGLPDRVKVACCHEGQDLIQAGAACGRSKACGVSSTLPVELDANARREG